MPIHTTLPIPWKLIDRDILVVVDEDASKRTPLPPAILWIVDITDETHPRSNIYLRSAGEPEFRSRIQRRRASAGGAGL